MAPAFLLIFLVQHTQAQRYGTTACIRTKQTAEEAADAHGAKASLQVLGLLSSDVMIVTLIRRVLRQLHTEASSCVQVR